MTPAEHPGSSCLTEMTAIPIHGKETEAKCQGSQLNSSLRCQELALWVPERQNQILHRSHYMNEPTALKQALLRSLRMC